MNKPNQNNYRDTLLLLMLRGHPIATMFYLIWQRFRTRGLYTESQG